MNGGALSVSCIGAGSFTGPETAAGDSRRRQPPEQPEPDPSPGLRQPPETAAGDSRRSSRSRILLRLFLLYIILLSVNR
jgi:hypothetical protein